MLIDTNLTDTARSRLDPFKAAVVRWVRGEHPDLTNRQLGLLLIVGIEPGQHHIRHLAARLDLAKPIVLRIVDRLTELGFVKPQYGRRDRRDVPVVATPEGLDFLGAFDRPPTGTMLIDQWR